ncbi:MAG: DNA recombination protein RmuC [Chlamydiota bacterium]|nr:DNA recombination protein RmuC [Chlamydiota bacterium]
MTISIIIMIFVFGIGAGFISAILIKSVQSRNSEKIFQESQTLHKAQMSEFFENIKSNFDSLSLESLRKTSAELVTLSKEKLLSQSELHQKELDHKKGLIDHELQRMNTELDNISKLVRELEKDRVEKFGELAHQLKASSEQTAALTQTTHNLREALANTKIRGQWGERMAEDILKLAGFLENVNYLKQKSTDSGSIPDFTFLMPKNLKLNMDVKFPLDNYLRHLESDNETEKTRLLDAFLKDVRHRIKEVTTREYIDTSNNTVDYVLLFIPNEQIFAFIHEQDQSVFDQSLKNHVIICSPITLFAVLAVIRQAIDNFTLEQTSNEILSLLGTFKKQWLEFIKRMDTLGKHITEIQEDYEALIGVRRRKLENPLNKIDDIRKERGLVIAQEPENQTTGIDTDI